MKKELKYGAKALVHLLLIIFISTTPLLVAAQATNCLLTPICHDGIRVELAPTAEGDGLATVLATDFIAADINGCPGQDSTNNSIIPAAYSIYRLQNFNEFEDSTYVSPFVDASVRSIALSCNDLACNTSGLVPVRIYAEDEAENKGYCNTFIQLLDNGVGCGFHGPGQLLGQITTENGQGVEDVEVQLTGSRVLNRQTDSNGNFVFFGFSPCNHGTITPQKDQDDLNGVSTFDLIVIQRHILGQILLDSPYKLIAADVNNSGSVTTLDLITLRKLILKIDPELRDNTSWRFVDADYTFPDPTNPWAMPFPEVKLFDDLKYHLSPARFTAIKIGDVNNSANTETIAPIAKPRSSNWSINTPEQPLIAGQEYVIPFYLNGKNFTGYQFAMALNQIELIDIFYGPTTSENFNFIQEDNIITTSFNGPIEGELFKLVIRAQSDKQLSEALSFNTQYLKPEVYTNDGRSIDLNLKFTEVESSDSPFILLQNLPNPFHQETMINFSLPRSGEAQLIIQDIAGRIVRVIEGDFYKGANLITLQKCHFSEKGMYFYTLRMENQSITKKMIFQGQ